MKPCINCQQLAVDPEDPPCYDVLNPNVDLNAESSTYGPYCPTCWVDTYTFQHLND